MKKRTKALLSAILFVSITCSCYSPPERGAKQFPSAGKQQGQQQAIGQLDSTSPQGPVAVGFHGGFLRGETIEWKARTFLKKQYKDFSLDPSNHGVMLFRPMNSTNCVTIRYDSDFGAPFWEASFDTNGVVRAHGSGISIEGN